MALPTCPRCGETDWIGPVLQCAECKRVGVSDVIVALTQSDIIKRRASDEIVDYLIHWLNEAEDHGQSPAPVSFGALVSEDMTMRDLVELARGRKVKSS